MSLYKMQIQDENNNIYHPETSSDIVKYKDKNVSDKLDTLTASVDANTNHLNGHLDDNIKHITSTERTKWNAVENKVDKANGMGLSSNDFSLTEKNKLASIASNANNYSHPTYTSKASGLYKVTVDSTGHISGTALVSKSDITGLGIPSQDTTYTIATSSQSGLMSNSDKSKLDSIAQGAQVNSITGIKGNAESNYRVGNVNITPDNIGASAINHTHDDRYYTESEINTKVSALSNSINEKAASSHTHNYLPLNGGTVTGNIVYSSDNELSWTRNTDYAKIRFKNTGDDDTDSYMEFKTGDNGNEYFKFNQVSGSTTTELMTIKSDHLRFKGNTVYHSANKPSKTDIGLGSVDNTSDINKPISTAVQNALNDKANTSHNHTTMTGDNGQKINVATGLDASGLGKTNNIDIASWFGVSFSNTCPSTGIQGAPSASIDVRNGNAFFAGDIFVKGQSTGLFQSVSNGKSAIATAVTGKGISASVNDTFATLASKIGQIKGSFISGKVPYAGQYIFDGTSRPHCRIPLEFTPKGFLVMLTSESFVISYHNPERADQWTLTIGTTVSGAKYNTKFVIEGSTLIVPMAYGGTNFIYDYIYW